MLQGFKLQGSMPQDLAKLRPLLPRKALAKISDHLPKPNEKPKPPTTSLPSGGRPMFMPQRFQLGQREMPQGEGVAEGARLGVREVGGALFVCLFVCLFNESSIDSLTALSLSLLLLFF